ncbi:MAG: glucose-1-phosphate adenylyltransferase [Candidatus Marinimicrobia bacterium]|nr:glucose-1-phosphate adenylyltransferase [Candidatus Neomarinimicrobiota bacterium]MCF7829443.1 glucose-1-phosphate adenylyltransferase [Candidatus Neomarinimicrobiota bacterium]MCF7880929.1 glucose-1-phosphate adenylyltransferase [Candidatus Neomarinimicrobiota bacterium]
MKDVAAIILGGGRGTRLDPLTRYRAKPAVPIAGKYRLIDIPISNCINSGIKQMFLLTQYSSASLHRHITQTYHFDAFSKGFIEILAAEQTIESEHWYQGTADAVRQNLVHFHNYPYNDYLILAGDHLYRMDYSKFVKAHREMDADITIAVKPVTAEEAKAFGILKVDGDRSITEFYEKPKTREELEPMASEIPEEFQGDAGDKSKRFLGSMGIYVFKPEVMEKAFKEDGDATDFGHDIIPRLLKTRKVKAYFFDDYWADIGTIRAFYNANLALTNIKPPFAFSEGKNPIYTHARFLPGTRFENTHVDSSFIADGGYVQANSVRNSIIGLRSRIGEDVEIESALLMGADFYQTDEEREEDKQNGIIPVGIGPGSKIRNAIIDKNARIGKNVDIGGQDYGEDHDEDNYSIRDGIVVVPKNSVIPDGAVI